MSATVIVHFKRHREMYTFWTVLSSALFLYLVLNNYSFQSEKATKILIFGFVFIGLIYTFAVFELKILLSTFYAKFILSQKLRIATLNSPILRIAVFVLGISGFMFSMLMSLRILERQIISPLAFHVTGLFFLMIILITLVYFSIISWKISTSAWRIIDSTLSIIFLDLNSNCFQGLISKLCSP